MKSRQEYPTNKKEDKVFLILISSGLNMEDIIFKDGPNEKGDRYLRIGYWKKLEPEVYAKIERWVTECEYDDDDCGTLFSYRFK